MKLGIVGLPNVGKSTLFNAITGTANAQAANYPFCTIEPNNGIVAVPDERLDKLSEYWNTDKKTPAVVEFVDIAGLVKGASKGAGLGNKFLGLIRECDAIIHVVRCFDNDQIMHVVEDANKAAAVDPAGDIECIDLELIFADIEHVDNRIAKQGKAAKTGNKAAKEEMALLEPLKAHLEEGKSARTFTFDAANDAHQQLWRELGLLSAKPIIYACNMDDDGVADPEANNYYQIVKKLAEGEDAQVLPICAKTEEELSDLDDEEKELFMEELGLAESGLDRLIKASYSLLGLISFLTDGKKECRAWTIKRGTKAPQAAGKIHSDFERGFIRAQVIAYDDLKAADFDYVAVRGKGQQRTEGKEYVVNDGDIIEFLFNV
ncbi:MAG: redox-regulated ATPase YchF [Clostridiales bacterium]|nr:redox-regulated ATPase YchF [Candidatus Blautia equi]